MTHAARQQAVISGLQKVHTSACLCIISQVRWRAFCPMHKTVTTGVAMATVGEQMCALGHRSLTGFDNGAFMLHVTLPGLCQWELLGPGLLSTEVAADSAALRHCQRIIWYEGWAGLVRFCCQEAWEVLQQNVLSGTVLLRRNELLELCASCMA